MRWSFILLATLASLSLGENLGEYMCTKYICETKFPNPDTCAKQTFVDNVMSLSLRGCNATSVCDIKYNLDEEAVCTPYYSIARFYPGEYCVNDAECYSGKCEKGTCVGLGENGICSSDTDCAAGLFCHEDVCMKAGERGKSCGEEFKCQAGLVCDNNICVLIGSKGNGQDASVPAACASQFATGKTCRPGPKLISPGGLEKCPLTGSCEYALDDGKTFMEPCVCGMTKEGSRFCNPGRGNVDTSDVRLLLIYWIVRRLHSENTGIGPEVPR